MAYSKRFKGKKVLDRHILVLGNGYIVTIRNCKSSKRTLKKWLEGMLELREEKIDIRTITHL